MAGLAVMSPELEAAVATAYCDCIRLRDKIIHTQTDDCVTVSMRAYTVDFNIYFDKLAQVTVFIQLSYKPLNAMQFSSSTLLFKH